MQWPVYSLAEHASQIIRNFHNGVPDPDDSNNTNNPSSGNNNGSSPNNGGGNNNHSGGVPSLSAPFVFTSAVALFFATLVVVL